MGENLYLSEVNKEHTNTVSGQNVQFFNVKPDGI